MMGKKQELANTMDFTGNDDLYPTEVNFVNGLNVRLACSEDGQLYLRVEDSSLGSVPSILETQGC